MALLIQLGTVVVRRRCRVPVARLRELDGAELWDAAERLAAAEERCRRAGEAVADRIAALVPAAVPQLRRELLRMRRDAFNGRAVACEALDLTEYQAAVAERTAGRARLERCAAALDEATGRTLHALLKEPDFAASVELSVPRLVAAALADAPVPGTARTRRRALTVLRLAQRAATKPSPFARFADSTLLLPGAAARPAAALVRVDRRAVDWVRAWAGGPGLAVLPPDRVLLTVNPSATLEQGRVGWLAPDGVRSARCTEQLATLLAGLRTPVALASLAPDGTLPPALAALLRTGLLEAGPQLPGWGPGRLAGAAQAVGPGELRSALSELQEIETAAPPAPVAAARAHAGLRRLAAACGQPEPAADRQLVTEDLVAVAPPEGPRFDPELLADLARVQRFAPLLGADLPFQLATALAFRARFGNGRITLLAGLRWYLAEGRQESDRLIAEAADPVLRQVLRLRQELVQALRALAAEPHSAAVPPALLEDLAAALPAEVAPWTNVSWPVQWAGEQLVLNGAALGFGRFPARLAGALSGPELLLLRREVAQTVPAGTVPADLAVQFGATANEHPLLLPAALAWPGSALECEPDARVDLATVTLGLTGTGRLAATSAAHPGRTLLPVPHNATLPALAPALYRFLTRLGPSQGSTLALWDLVDASAAAGGVRHYPRLTLGRLVLCRRTWKVPGEDLPAEDDTMGWLRWSGRTGVPRRSFLRRTTLPDPWQVLRRGAADQRVEQARARTGAADRKPAYLDLAQPLGRPHPTAPGEILTFTEPLPDPLTLPDDQHTVEYVIETHWRTP
ncbi:hypothetical protein C7C46_13110 [Streptomyces tateyamensis]|uniref:Lantibiotic dehydratase N-terminal domain-containing protein n=1 Tax=Streptomyces tateyamensis TaxID=565073 RepID=A0A2V4NKU5_9ACTN|nr:lantibiotic dehydratase [Streptomyces tateyamensis]AXG25752.1 lantibiotic dehydratase [Streptomyces tateyamensis]PYC80223.1 hypothetical protein C7C46_13110 [Streptomyces tateyamensis]